MTIDLPGAPAWARRLRWTDPVEPGGMVDAFLAEHRTEAEAERLRQPLRDILGGAPVTSADLLGMLVEADRVMIDALARLEGA